MPGYRPRSLRSALVSLLLPLLLALAVAGGALVAAQWKVRVDAVEGRLRDVAENLALALEREIAVETVILETISQSPLIDRGDWAGLHALASRVAARRQGSVIAFMDREGRTLFNTAIAYGTPVDNVLELERERRSVEWRGHRLPVSTGGLSRRAREVGAPVFSNLYFGIVSQQPNLAVAVPIARNGAFEFTVLYVMSARSVAGLIAKHRAFPEAVAMVLDREGRVVASTHGHDELVGQPVPSQAGQMTALATAGSSGWRVMLTVPKQQALASATSWLAGSVALLVAFMLTASMLVYRHSRRLGVPLTQLSRRVISREEPLPRSDIREIALLAEAVRTSEEARDSEKQEQLRRRLAEEREAHARRLMEELQHADRRKNEFLRNLAHELRNPMGPLTNAVYLLQHRSPGDPGHGKLIEVMKRQLSQVGSLIEDLLDVTRIAQGKVRLHRRPMDLGPLITRIAEDHGELLRSRALDLVLDLPEEAVHAEVDATRFTQMVANLVLNAAKFTEPRGRIVMSLRREEGNAVVTVSDTGMGIDPALAGRLFEPFEQIDRGTGGRGAGLGLGLAIVKGIAELHGGSVAARSEGAGQGTEFRVVLPSCAG